MKNLGSSVILVSHRQGVLPLVDYLMFYKMAGLVIKALKRKLLSGRTRKRKEHKLIQKQSARKLSR